MRRDHPYETPEILAVPVLDGFAPYLDWIAAETAPPD
ncbi:MAG: divalent cation tolerance protein CutA [Burkholderiales bacterium]